MNISTKLLKAAAGQAGGASLDVDEVFSTFLYDGTGSAQTITNGIDLSGEGGLVWIKRRDGAGTSHDLEDTVRGAGKNLRSNTTTSEDNQSGSSGIGSFNSNGFTVIGSNNKTNASSLEYVSWTFRNSPMFQVVTWTGNSVSSSAQTISHNLGSDVGMILVKRVSNADSWAVWHRYNATGTGFLDLTNAFYTNISAGFISSVSSTSFSAGESINVNGDTFVAYVFAHHDGDGGFGPDSDQDIIKCGSYTGNTSTRPSINLGFEPQFLMIKRTDSSDNWYMLDTMRGILTNGGNDTYLYANTNGAEATVSEVLKVTATGFELEDDFGGWNASGGTYIYMAIRRGPLAVPEDATKVFHANKFTSTGFTEYTGVGFAPDLAIQKAVSSGDNWDVVDKLRGPSKALETNSSDAEATGTQYFLGGFLNNGVKMGSETNGQFNGWNPNLHLYWKRAPGYFDVVAYSGTGSARTVSHNLSAVPEMMWIKRRSNTQNWAVYHKGANGGTDPEDYGLELNSTSAEFNTNLYFNDTAPTSTVFTVGTQAAVNTSGETYIAYLFASVDSVSKCGSYSGNGSTTGPIVDCGFSSGARFVLIKRIDQASDWSVYDTVRGITAGDDKTLELNTSDSETTGQVINPHSSGFQLATADSFANASGGTYIFYAIA